MGNSSSLRLAATLGGITNARRRKRDAAGPVKNGLAGIGLEVLPGSERRRHEPGIRRVGIGMPRDPGGPV